jgi:hypothetical protein
MKFNVWYGEQSVDGAIRYLVKNEALVILRGKASSLKEMCCPRKRSVGSDVECIYDWTVPFSCALASLLQMSYHKYPSFPIRIEIKLGSRISAD